MLKRLLWIVIVGLFQTTLHASPVITKLVDDNVDSAAEVYIINLNFQNLQSNKIDRFNAIISTLILSGFTPGSILFINSSTQIAENNALFFWDNVNHRIAIGTSTTDEHMHILMPETVTSLFHKHNDDTTSKRSLSEYRHTTTEQMVNGFGGTLFFSVQDVDSGKQNIAGIAFERDDTDDSGKLILVSYLEGDGRNNAVLTKDGFFGIGTEDPLASLHVVSSTPTSLDNLEGGQSTVYLVNVSSSSTQGSLGPMLSFSGNAGPARKKAGISSIQTGSDVDNVGLAFFTHPSGSGGAAIVLEMLLEHDGDLHIQPVGNADAQFELSDGVTLGNGSGHGIFGTHSSREIKSHIRYLTSTNTINAHNDLLSLKHAKFKYKSWKSTASWYGDITYFVKVGTETIMRTRKVLQYSPKIPLIDPKNPDIIDIIYEDVPDFYKDNNERGKAIMYRERFVILERAYQYQNTIIESLKRRINTLESK